MAIYVYWFLLAVILLGLEMASGTFYLLVLSIALAVAGFAALMGFALPLQYAMAAITGVIGVVILRLGKGSLSDAGNQSLDLGRAVKILSWHDGSKARVMYRGAEWDAELDTPQAAHDGEFYIKAIQGSVLILTHHKVR